MPTAFTHIFISGYLGRMAFPERMPTRFWVLAVLCTMLPDADVIGYHYFGISYAALFGHRGFFHSPVFALVVSCIVVQFAFSSIERLSRKWWAMIIFFFIVTASHGFLDAMTDKGLGVAFLSPFSNTRYFLPWRPIHASPMSIANFFNGAGLEVLAQEIIWLWIPLLLSYVGMAAYRRRRRGRQTA